MDKEQEIELAVTDLPSRDEVAALESAGGNAELARILVSKLVQGLPTELSELGRCARSTDWAKLVAATRRMRGASSYCGVPALDGHLEKLERTVKKGDHNRVAIALRRVELEAERLKRLVEGRHGKSV